MKISREDLRKLIMEQAATSGLEKAIKSSEAGRAGLQAVDMMSEPIFGEPSIVIKNRDGEEVEIPMSPGLLSDVKTGDIFAAMKVIEKILSYDQFKYTTYGMMAVAMEMGPELTRMLKKGEYQRAYDSFISRYKHM